MKFEDLKNDIKKIEELEITTYLSLATKQLLIEGVEDKKGLLDNILVQNESGLWKIDFTLYEIYTTNQLCNWYLDIEFGDTFTSEDYDFIKKNNIEVKLTNDAYVFEEMLNKYLKQEIEQRNSLSNTLIRISDKFMAKLDDISDPKKMNKLMKTYEKIKETNPELLTLVKGMQNK